MKRFWVQWGEGYLYHPSWVQKILSFFLLPLSWLYCWIAYLRYRRSVPKSFGIPVVSVGNLTVGGSGKTPVVIELAKQFDKPAIVLRGYGRKSHGMVVVKDKSTILCDVIKSGDEAMLYAQLLPHATVIVSEIRERGIAEAASMGCEVVLLDDGYGKHSIDKLDLVIDVVTPNRFCLPSGAYREKLWSDKRVVMLQEGRTFKRSVTIQNPTEKMVLVTAIARPQRLDPFLPEVIEKVYFEDHHFFTQGELEMIVERTGATSLLVTSKDLVKMSSFKLNISVLELSIELNETIITTVKDYVNAAKN
ncbi:tetraacyldisaccharide 4'-kinase [Sulfuricurvum sp.]|uniref:tetraacyldisaccharide 4'-kinase n=1 Tax=Sulfuricurvum sp. TaxID=2025608 RepID=UPI003C4B96F8